MKFNKLIKTDQMVAFVLFLAIGVFGYLLPVIGYFSSVPGDLGDARFNSVILEHLYRWICGRDPSLWSPSFFYPFKGALGFSDNHFGSGITYIFFRWLGFTREGAYNGWFLVGGLLNYLVTYFVLRRLAFSGLAAAAGAFTFAFALPAELHQNGHAQLLYRYAIPLAVLGFFHALETGRAIYLGQTFFWVAVEFFCSIYLGLFLVYLLVASAFGLLFFKWGRHRLMQMISSIPGESALNKVGFVVITVSSTLAVGLLLYRYQAISREYGFTRLPAEIANMLPRLGSYLLSDRSGLSSWIGFKVANIQTRWEHQMFVGVGVLIVATYGALVVLVAKRKEVFGQVALISLALLFVATLQVNGQSIYLWLIKIPGLSAIRAVSRIILVMLFPISVLVAIGIERIRSADILRNRQMMFAFSVGLAVLLGAETASYKPDNELIAAWQGRIAAVKMLLPARLVDRPILYISRSHEEPFYSAELDGMILGQEMGIPTLNGYSGNTPPGYNFDSEPCLPYVERLYAYADFRNLPKETTKALARRVVHLAPEPCKREIIVGSEHIITASQAKLMQVTVNGIDFPGKHFWVTITNNSTQPFNPLSLNGDVRLSWRFVPLNEKDVAMADPGWDTRKDIRFVIRPGVSAPEIMVETDFPNLPGRYRLEVTLVQDGVSWLHDLGMPIGTKIGSNL